MCLSICNHEQRCTFILVPRHGKIKIPPPRVVVVVFCSKLFKGRMIHVDEVISPKLGQSGLGMQIPSIRALLRIWKLPPQGPARFKAENAATYLT